MPWTYTITIVFSVVECAVRTGFIEVYVYKRFPIVGIKNWLKPKNNKTKNAVSPGGRHSSSPRTKLNFSYLNVNELNVYKRFPISGEEVGKVFEH